MAFTIKGLARRYQLEERTAEALAELWQYWVSSNDCEYNCAQISEERRFYEMNDLNYMLVNTY